MDLLELEDLEYLEDLPEMRRLQNRIACRDGKQISSMEISGRSLKSVILKVVKKKVEEESG